MVWFYWDGLVSDEKIGKAQTWNNAVGYSQLAGTHGLRDVLNALHDKEIIIIAHSRGASVVLSALSNPPYRKNFIKDTTWMEVNGSAPLRDNGNKIKIIFLAPAIGRIDFRTPCYYCGDNSFRDLGSQLKRIHYSLNFVDGVLGKSIIPSGKFNPTGFGYNSAEGRALNERYGILTPHSFTNDHAFTSYIDASTFKEMLIACEVDVKE